MREPNKVVLFNDLIACRQKSGVGCYAAQLLRHLPEDADDVRILPLSQTLAGSPLRSASKWYDTARKSSQTPFEAQAATAKQRIVKLIKKYGHAALDAYLKSMAKLIPCGLYHEPDALPLSIHAPTVATVHDLSVLLFPHWHPEHRVRKYHDYLKQSIARTQCFVAVSEATKQDMIKHLGIGADQIHVVPEAPRPEFRTMPEEEVDLVLGSLNLDRPYLLYVGTIEPRKNVAGLLRAYGRLPASLRKSHPLVLVGGWGWRSETVRNMLTQSPWSESVRWIGYLEDDQLVAVMNGALGLVYPSFYEGFGLPPLEAMACQTPVITTHAGSLEEVVGDAAIVVDPEDEDDLTQAMKALILHPEVAAEYQSRGLAHVSQFSWKKTAQATRQVYRKVA